jgi:hypothetical protein
MDKLSAVRPRTFLTGVVLTLVIGAVLFAIWPMPRVEQLAGEPVLDTRGFAAGTAAAAYIDRLGDEGRRLYAIMLSGDIIWTLIHGFTVALGIVLGVSRSRLDDRLRWLALAPLTAAVLDIAENSAFLAAIAAHPDGPPLPAAVMNVITGTKFIVLAVGYVALAVALVAWARSRRGQTVRQTAA